MYLYVGNRTPGLKIFFWSFKFAILLEKIFRDPLESENIFFSEVPFVGTLNLCLRLPDNMQKMKN